MSSEKETPLNIRYSGFETTPDGGRVFDFSITAAGRPSVRVALDIAGGAFAGTNRISYQEAAKICYEKLRGVLEGSGVPAEPRLQVTVEDIARFRHIPRGRSRPVE